MSRSPPTFSLYLFVEQSACRLKLSLSFLLQVRSLRLRIQKTKNIGEAKYDITSVQDDHSEINLSSGRISVDLLCKQEMCEREGTTT